MKILTIVVDLGIGGTQRVAQNFTYAYHKAGYQVKVLATKSGGVREEFFKRKSIQYLIGDTPKNHTRAIQYLTEWAPDIVHVHNLSLRYEDIACLRKKLLNSIFIETNVFSWPSSISKFFDISFQLTEWCKWFYLCQAPRIAKKQYVDILPNMVDSENFFKSREEGKRLRLRYDIPLEAFVFCRIGRPAEGNWSPVLIDIYEKVYYQCDNIHLLLVGPPKSVRERINNLNKKVKCTITIIDQIYDDDILRACYNAGDVFTHIARIGESFGMVITEAMLCEIPVVTLTTPFRGNSQAEVVMNGKGGMVCATVKGYEKAMMALCKNKELYESFSAKARHIVLTRFGHEVVLNKLFNMIENHRNGMVKIPLYDPNSVIEIYKNTTDKPYALVCFMIKIRYPLARILACKLYNNIWTAITAFLSKRYLLKAKKRVKF